MPLRPSHEGPIVRVCLGWRNSAGEPLRVNGTPVRFFIPSLARWEKQEAKHAELTVVQLKGEVALRGGPAKRLLTYHDLGSHVADYPRCHDFGGQSSGR